MNYKEVPIKRYYRLTKIEGVPHLLRHYSFLLLFINTYMLQWRIQDFEKGGSSVHVTDRRGVWHMWGHVPPGKFLISDLLRLLLVPF